MVEIQSLGRAHVFLEALDVGLRLDRSDGSGPQSIPKWFHSEITNVLQIHPEIHHQNGVDVLRRGAVPKLLESFPALIDASHTRLHQPFELVLGLHSLQPGFKKVLPCTISKRFPYRYQYM